MRLTKKQIAKALVEHGRTDLAEHFAEIAGVEPPAADVAPGEHSTGDSVDPGRARIRHGRRQRALAETRLDVTREALLADLEAAGYGSVGARLVHGYPVPGAPAPSSEEAAPQKRADRVKALVDLQPVGAPRAKARMRLGREGADVPPVPEEVTYVGGDAIPSGTARIRSARRDGRAAD